MFATRWTPIIVRNLLLGCRTYGELRAGAAGIPRSLLSDRLRQLEEHGLVRRRPNPRGRGWLYEPTRPASHYDPCATRSGRGARPGSSWRRSILDPYMALWGLCRWLGGLRCPRSGSRSGSSFRAIPRSPTALLAARAPAPAGGLRQPPGFDEDLVVTTDPEWLARWVLGQTRSDTG